MHIQLRRHLGPYQWHYTSIILIVSTHSDPGPLNIGRIEKEGGIRMISQDHYQAHNDRQTLTV